MAGSMENDLINICFLLSGWLIVITQIKKPLSEKIPEAAVWVGLYFMFCPRERPGLCPASVFSYITYYSIS